MFLSTRRKVDIQLNNLQFSFHFMYYLESPATIFNINIDGVVNNFRKMLSLFTDECLITLFVH